MVFDTVIAGKFYMDYAFQELEIGINAGKIAKIGKHLKGGTRKEIEGGIMPAGTDIHVHFRDPGETDKEDFRTGTISAAFGGTTTIFDMPNNRRAILDYASFSDKLASVRNRAYVDFGLYSMFNGQNADIIDGRSSSIKIYLGGSTNSLPAGDFSTKALAKLREMKLPVIFHGEDAKCLAVNKREEVYNLIEHDLSRPEVCELISAERIRDLAIEDSVMGHISTPESLPIIGEGIKSEVTPHHLLLNSGMDLGSWGKVNPPVREKGTQEKNLQAYLDGKFSILSSDHAPHTEHDKEEFVQAPSGIIGVETRIPLLLALVQKKVLDLRILYDTAIKNPAELMNANKGKIEVGSWADFFSFKFNSVKRINQERLHSKTPISPFHEFPAIFPEFVTLRGEILIDRGEMVEDRSGQHMKDSKA